jgi:hypothetical protein
MIRILCQPGVEEVGRNVGETLQNNYGLNPRTQLLPEDAVFHDSNEWDDLLIVVYRSDKLPEAGRKYIQAYRDAHLLIDARTRAQRPGGVIVPVATDPRAAKPPDPISGIKAQVEDDTAWGPEDRLIRWVDIFLGMLLRRGEYLSVFSCRATDGRPVAEDLYGGDEDQGC